MPTESPRHRLIRYAIVAAIVLTIGALFVRQRLEERGSGDVAAALSRAQIEVDTTAPDFTLDTPSGRVLLSETRGRIVVLNFWATWCVPCKQEMPEFEALYRARGDRDITVIAINAIATDSRAAAIEFARELGLTFPIAFDARGEVMRAYGVQGLPATFFIDREGIVRARSLGPQDREQLRHNVRAAGG
ncbi:MAG: TlpA family protein disulfide reductase [Dehalococcoidia bacterium]|nr:TlpA family protein disulfide reductase [Dehalococcoidia bacterium]